MDGPVVVIMTALVCNHCHGLLENMDAHETECRKICSDVRFHYISTVRPGDPIDETIYPSDLFNYKKWVPMVLLVPGRLWDVAMASLGPGNPVLVRNGVQIFNAAPLTDEQRLATPGALHLTHVQRYDYREGFVRWFRDSLMDPEFRQVQYFEGDLLSLCLEALDDSKSRRENRLLERIFSETR